MTDDIGGISDSGSLTVIRPDCYFPYPHEYHYPCTEFDIVFPLFLAILLGIVIYLSKKKEDISMDNSKTAVYAQRGILIALPVLALAIILSGTTTPPTIPATQGQFVTIQGTGCLQVFHPDGTSEDATCATNTVSEKGLNWTRDVLSRMLLSGTQVNDTNYVNWTFIELSTNNVVVAESDLTCSNAVTGNGMDIAIADAVIREGKGNFTISKSFSVTGTQNNIRKICISNSSTSASNDLMASINVSSTNVANGDTLVANYSLAIQNA